MAWKFLKSDSTEKVDVQPLYPVGAMLDYAGSSAPDGWLLCNGQEISKQEYPILNSVLGTTYGANTNGSGGAGTTHFRLPDTRGRVTAGTISGATISAFNRIGADQGGNTLGSVGGLEAVTLSSAQTASHTHPTVIGTASVSITHGCTGGSGHTHDAGDTTYDLWGFTSTGGQARFIGGGTNQLIAVSRTNVIGHGHGAETISQNAHTHTHGTIGTSPASPTSHTNLMPYQVLNKIIRAE